MQALRSGVSLFLFVLVGSLLLVSQAQAAESCHDINVKGVGRDNFNNTTVAGIIGCGLLQGLAEGLFEPCTGSPPDLSCTGTVTFTTLKGTLTVDVVELFNVGTGEFSVSGTVTAGTGKFEHATGELKFVGKEDLSTGKFTEDITGEICLPRKRTGRQAERR